MRTVTEYISFKVSYTPDEIMKAIVGGNNNLILARKYKTFNEAIEIYEQRGYSITSKDYDNLTFTAEKTFEDEEL